MIEIRIEIIPLRGQISNETALSMNKLTVLYRQSLVKVDRGLSLPTPPPF